MNIQLKVPAAVREAGQAKQGLHWALEILVFVAMFLVCTFAEGILTFPVLLVTLLQDPQYRMAILSGDAAKITELSTVLLQTDDYVIVSLYATAAMILLVFAFCRLFQKRKLSSLGFIREKSGKNYCIGLLLGAAMFSAAVLLCILTGSVTFAWSGRFVLSGFLLFFAGYMVQGMAEEVLCRGYFMVSVGRRYPMIVAVLFNSVAFAALHLFNSGIAPLAIVNLVLFGIFASLCFIQTDNIWLVGALHSAWNFMQGNVYGVLVSGNRVSCSVLSAEITEGRELINGGAFGFEGGLAVSVVFLAGIAVLLFMQKKKRTVEGE